MSPDLVLNLMLDASPASGYTRSCFSSGEKAAYSRKRWQGCLKFGPCDNWRMESLAYMPRGGAEKGA
jgi:hypothetical protein